MPTKKYFIAIIPPAPVFEEIEAIKRELELKYRLKGALRSPAHITMHRPFLWKEENESILLERLNLFSFEAPFEIVLNGFGFFEPRVIYTNVVSNTQLHELHTKLKTFAKRQLNLFNEAEDLRGFHPHITLASRDLKKLLFYELQKEFVSKPFQGAFNYQGLSLLKLDKKWELVNS